MRRRTRALGVLLGAALVVLAATGALAVGTRAGTVITNTASVTYEDANGNTVATVTASVTTTVSLVFGVDLSPATAAQSGTNLTTVYYPAVVTNTGNFDDIFDLVAASTAGWTPDSITIYADANENSVLDAGETTVVSDTGTVVNDDMFYVIVAVAIPNAATALNGTTNDVTLTATSRADNTYFDTSVFTTTATTGAAITVTTPVSAISADPGDTVAFAVEIDNGGTVADSYTLTYAQDTFTYVFYLDDGDGVFEPGIDDVTPIGNTGSVPVGDSVTVWAVTTVPVGTPDTTTDTITVTVTSDYDPSVYATTGNLTVTVTAPFLTIAKTVAPVGPQPPGTVLTYTISIANTGTGNATGVIITDSVPMYTTYQTGTLQTGTTVVTLTGKTDGSGDDDANITGTTITAGEGGMSLTAGGTYVLRFQVKID